LKGKKWVPKAEKTVKKPKKPKDEVGVGDKKEYYLSDFPLMK